MLNIFTDEQEKLWVFLIKLELYIEFNHKKFRFKMNKRLYTVFLLKNAVFNWVDFKLHEFLDKTVKKKWRQKINIWWLQKVQRETSMNLQNNWQEISSWIMYSYSAAEWISDQVLNRVLMNCSIYRVKQWDFYITILLRTQRHYQEQDSKNE